MNTDLMAELLGGASRYQALRHLYGQPERQFRVRELAAEAGVDAGNASRWLRRWADVGLLEQSFERGQPVYAASRNPALSALHALLRHGGETAEVLGDALAQLEVPVQAAAIFGSFARGEAGPDSDVDLLLIVDGLSTLDAQAHFKPAGRRLGRPVNVLLYTPEAWRHARARGDTLVQDILSRDVIALRGDPHAIA